VNDPASLETTTTYCDDDVRTEEGAERRLIPLSDYEWRVYALNETIVRRALELRQEAAKTSVSKIQAMLDRVSRDGRIRGVYLHHGAGQTGRFSSRGVQMPTTCPATERSSRMLTLVRISFRRHPSEDPAVLELLYGPELGRPLHLVSDAIRGFLWAAPGHDLIDVDYSSIEGRMAAWFAGETWKLDAYRALDRGEGHGIYELTAAGIFGVPVEAVNKPQRQGGKVGELSMGYQGG
jgi:DNA polymerase